MKMVRMNKKGRTTPIRNGRPSLRETPAVSGDQRHLERWPAAHCHATWHERLHRDTQCESGPCRKSYPAKKQKQGLTTIPPGPNRPPSAECQAPTDRTRSPCETRPVGSPQFLNPPRDPGWHGREYEHQRQSPPSRNPVFGKSTAALSRSLMEDGQLKEELMENRYYGWPVC